MAHQGRNLFAACDFGKDLTYLTIAPYKDHLFWAYATDGLYLLNAQKKTIADWIPMANPFTYNYDLYNMYYSPATETLFVGSGIGRKGEAFKITPTGTAERRKDFRLSDIKAAIDYKGKTVFGLDGGGLAEWADNKLTHLTPQNSSISSDAIHTLNMANGALSHNMVTSICPTKDKIYIGLDGGGLNIYDRATGKTTIRSRQNSGLGGNNVMSMCADGPYIWIGVYEKGLYRFSCTGQTFKHYDLAGISGNRNANQIWTLHRDKDGLIWVLGTSIFILDPKRESLTALEDIPWASSIVSDGDTVWIGSAYSGLYKISGKSRNVLAHYYKGSEDFPLESNEVRYIYMDSARNLWLSTGEGLFRLKPDKAGTVSYARRRELADNRITSITEDGQGHLWMGTYKGLYKYNPHDDSFVHIGGMDGWKNGQFNYHAQAKDSAFIYMGFTKGLVCFNPAEIRHVSHDNPVCFQALDFPDHPEESFRWHDKGGKTITLPHDRNFFTIRFSAAEILAPEEIRFAYYMEGFEEKWKETGSERHASYTNVPPGEYTFHVKSTDTSGHWNSHESSLHITITPPWWQTGWAWGLWILLMGSALFSVFRFYRHELNIKHLVRLKEIEKETARNINEAKLRFYTNVVHELRTPIFLITAPLEELMSGNKRTVSVPKSYLTSMYRNAMKLNKLITRMIDLRKLEQGKLQLTPHSQNAVLFCKDLVPDYEALCQQKNIIFHFLPEKTIIKAAFDEEKLEIILSNLISNAFKYTPEGGKIVLSIHETDKEAVFTVEDKTRWPHSTAERTPTSRSPSR